MSNKHKHHFSHWMSKCLRQCEAVHVLHFSSLSALTWSGSQAYPRNISSIKDHVHVKIMYTSGTFSLAKQIASTVCSWAIEGNWKGQRKATWTWRQDEKLHTDNNSKLSIKLGPWNRKAPMLPAAPLRIQVFSLHAGNAKEQQHITVLYINLHINIFI